MTKTDRQFIQECLDHAYDGGLSVEQICNRLYHRDGVELDQSEVLDHLVHIKRSLRNYDDAELLGTPPRCEDCGFEDFDSILNVPSSCPNCRSERIDEPRFKIE